MARAIPPPMTVHGNPYHNPDFSTEEALAAHGALITDTHGITDYQGRRVSLFNPYQPATNRYKVQLHCHTTNSDGADAPAALMAAYEAAGYDAVAITDHNPFGGGVNPPTPDPGGHGILHIPGVEEGEATGHLLNLFAIAERWDTNAITTHDLIMLDGALVAPAHAFFPWSTNPSIEGWISSMLGCPLLEIINHAMTDPYYDTGWQQLLDSGKNIWAIGVDDCHDIAGAGFNQAFVEVMADSLSLATLMESLRNGNFYVRQTGAPQLTITLSGNTITASTGAVLADITFLGRNGIELKAENGVVTSDFVIQGWDGYIRIRVLDNATATFYSCSQPIGILSPGNPVSRANFHSPTHALAEEDEINIKDLYTGQLTPYIYKAWWDSTGFTEDVGVGASVTLNSTHLAYVYLQTGATAGRKASVHANAGVYHAETFNYRVRFATRILPWVVPTDQTIWVGCFETPAAPTGIQRHIGFTVEGSELFATCGDGAIQNKSAKILDITQFGIYHLRYIYIGITRVDFYVNNVKVHTATANAPFNAYLRPLYYIINSADANKTLFCSPLFIFQGRITLTGQ